MRHRDELERELWRGIEAERLEVLTVISLASIAVTTGLILLTVAMMVAG